MRVAFFYGPMCLSFRGSLDLPNCETDPRGLSGSEWGIIRTAEEVAKLGHEVHLYTLTDQVGLHRGIHVHSFEDRHRDSFDVAIAWNDPRDLIGVRADLRVCEQCLNSFEYCPKNVEDLVDLWTSPSEAHRQMVLGQEHVLALDHNGEPGAMLWHDSAKWVTVELGCDLPIPTAKLWKTPGRVIYTSSPDRGLHWLLQEWPAIRRAVPHAHLRIFYRLKPWIDGFKGTGYYPPIEPLRDRAVYIEDALRRLEGHGVEVVDSVSREQIRKEQMEAMVLAYPLDPIRWTEGFSCSVLEACAAEACPVITDVDAFPTLYGALDPVPRGDWAAFRERVIRVLTDECYRFDMNEAATKLAEEKTWKKRATKLMAVIQTRQSGAT